MGAEPGGEPGNLALLISSASLKYNFLTDEDFGNALIWSVRDEGYLPVFTRQSGLHLEVQFFASNILATSVLEVLNYHTSQKGGFCDTCHFFIIQELEETALGARSLMRNAFRLVV